MAGRRQTAVTIDCRLHRWLPLMGAPCQPLRPLQALLLQSLLLAPRMLAMPAPLPRSQRLNQEQYQQPWSCQADCWLPLRSASHGFPAASAGRHYFRLGVPLLVLSTSALPLFCGPGAVEGCQQTPLPRPLIGQHAVGPAQQVLQGVVLLDSEKE